MKRWEIWRTEGGQFWLEAPAGRGEYRGRQWRVAVFSATRAQAESLLGFLQS